MLKKPSCLGFGSDFTFFFSVVIFSFSFFAAASSVLVSGVLATALSVSCFGCSVFSSLVFGLSCESTTSGVLFLRVSVSASLIG